MKSLKKVLTLAILVPAALAIPAFADATLYAVHGINGTDLGLAKALPVDVSVNGACALPDFRFGEITDGIALPSGRYDVIVSLRDTATPCGGAAVISASVNLRNNRQYSLVAHLDTSSAPTASLIKLNTRPIRDGFGRTQIVHAAVAPRVDVTVSRNKSENGGLVDGIVNGRSAVAALSDFDWQARIYPSLGDQAVAGPAALPVVGGNVTVVYAVGTLANGTFELLANVVPTR